MSAARSPSVKKSQPRTPIFQDTLEDKQFATTLARGLEILRCFTPDKPVLGNKDLADATGLPKATVSRFTYTLTKLGYLRSAQNQHKHQLGSAVLSLGYPLLATMYVRQVARPHMTDLANEVGGAVAMGIRDRLNIVYVEASRSQALFVPPYTEIGYSHPIAATSIGRAYLGISDAEKRTAIMNEIRVKRPQEWARYHTSITRSLKDFHRLGFCISSDFFRPNIYGVGVPLRRAVDGEVIVFNCAVYADRVSFSQLESHVGPRLLAMSRRVENALDR